MRGRRCYWGVFPAGAALTRTGLSVVAKLRGRSAGLRRASLHRCLTRPVTGELMLGCLGWLKGCRAAAMMMMMMSVVGEWVGAG